MDGKGSGYHENVVGFADDGLDVAVGLVVDFADNLFNEVFHGDDTVDGAVFVDDDGELLAPVA